VGGGTFFRTQCTYVLFLYDYVCRLPKPSSMMMRIYKHSALQLLVIWWTYRVVSCLSPNCSTVDGYVALISQYYFIVTWKKVRLNYTPPPAGRPSQGYSDITLPPSSAEVITVYTRISRKILDEFYPWKQGGSTCMRGKLGNNFCRHRRGMLST